MLQPVKFRNKHLPSKLREICSAAMPNANTARSDIALRTMSQGQQIPFSHNHTISVPQRAPLSVIPLTRLKVSTSQLLIPRLMEIV